MRSTPRTTGAVRRLRALLGAATAIAVGAAHVELPISYKTDATPTSLLTYNRQLISNATG
jgi:hypothetical protein